LDSSITELIISLEFVKKQEFKLKKIERPIYVRNIDDFIEHMVEIFIIRNTQRG